MDFADGLDGAIGYINTLGVSHVERVKNFLLRNNKDPNYSASSHSATNHF